MRGPGFGLVVAIIAVAGCERRAAAPVRAPTDSAEGARALAERANKGDAEHRAPPTAAGGGPTESEVPDDDIARARCEHLARCGAIGEGRAYETVDGCLAASRAAARDDLSAETCGALRPGAAEECAAAWRAQACGAKVSERPNACRREQMCR